MSRYAKASLLVLGLIFILLGFVGLFVPVLQGIIFLVVGVYILSVSSSRFKTWFDEKLGRFPRIKAHYDAQIDRAKSILWRFRKK